MITRWTRISQRKTAFMGAAYTDQWVGLQVVHTTTPCCALHPAERLVGVIERFDGFYPIIRFADGKWARGTDALELVEG